MYRRWTRYKSVYPATSIVLNPAERPLLAATAPRAGLACAGFSVVPPSNLCRSSCIYELAFVNVDVGVDVQLIS